MKWYSATIFLIFSAVLFTSFLLCPDRVQQTAYESVVFCASVIVPSLFPGFVLSDLIIGLWQGDSRSDGGLFFLIFRLPSAAFRCWLIGLLAGFPAAADSIVRAYRRGALSKESAERCLAFTNNPGIVFVICAVGSGLFGSFAVGLFLWCIQTVSAILIGVVIADPGCNSVPLPKKDERFRRSFIKLFPRAVVSSVSSVLNVCGFVVFFRVLVSVLSGAVPLYGAKIFFSGLLEITCGISAFSTFTYEVSVLSSFILGWSGFSVHFQILNVISESDLSAGYYFPGKLAQALLSSVVTAVFYPLFFSHPFSAGFWISLPALSLFLLTAFAVRFRKELIYGKRNFQSGKTAP